jgi:hypothetical protein
MLTAAQMLTGSRTIIVRISARELISGSEMKMNFHPRLPNVPKKGRFSAFVNINQ